MLPVRKRMSLARFYEGMKGRIEGRDGTNNNLELCRIERKVWERCCGRLARVRGCPAPLGPLNPLLASRWLAARVKVRAKAKENDSPKLRAWGACATREETKNK